jgi:hypothetical protein
VRAGEVTELAAKAGKITPVKAEGMISSFVTVSNGVE